MLHLAVLLPIQLLLASKRGHLQHPQVAQQDDTRCTDFAALRDPYAAPRCSALLHLAALLAS
jgi:hypothetical protein